VKPAQRTKAETTKPVQIKKPNDFQLGIDDVREAIDGQRGVRIRMPSTVFCGQWPDATEMCIGKLMCPSYEGKFVAEALFDGDTEPTLLTSSSLMLSDTHVSWRKPNMDASNLLRTKCSTNVKHLNAMTRAVEMYQILLDAPVNLSGRIVLTLDGIGTNRVSGEEVLEVLPGPERPKTLTLEMNADVALSQRICLGFGKLVRFTGADPSMAYKSHSMKKSGPPTIEDVLVTPNNTVLSEEEKRRTVWLNLDYCGGPPKNHSVDECAAFMSKCLAHLPQLYMVTVTMARRNHSNLDETFADYFPTPYGFTVRKTYTDNARVVCKMYVRKLILVRHLSVPGYWWRHTSTALRTTTFDGIVVGKDGDMYDVYILSDGAQYKMRADAVAEYSDDDLLKA
jgi:hypothetical protein